MSSGYYHFIQAHNLSEIAISIVMSLHVVSPGAY